MKLKDQILESARMLFNIQGIRNITLRDVASSLGRSYGNITYHFPDKEALLVRLYEQYIIELEQINQAFRPGPDLLEMLLDAPSKTFALSMKYVFFFVDYVEIRRAYPSLSHRIDLDNAGRMQLHLSMLLYLREKAILRPDLSEDDLRYLMELSGAIRTFFFLQLRPEELSLPGLQESYVDKVNRLLQPYLVQPKP